MEFMVIRDTITGEELRVAQPSPESDWLVEENDEELKEVRKRSVGKVIRTWMKERRDEGEAKGTMKILDKISLKAMLSHRKNCRVCWGTGCVVSVSRDLDATKFREVRPCSCVKQIVRIEEESIG